MGKGQLALLRAEPLWAQRLVQMLGSPQLALGMAEEGKVGRLCKAHRHSE